MNFIGLGGQGIEQCTEISAWPQSSPPRKRSGTGKRLATYCGTFQSITQIAVGRFIPEVIVTANKPDLETPEKGCFCFDACDCAKQNHPRLADLETELLANVAALAIGFIAFVRTKKKKRPRFKR